MKKSKAKKPSLKKAEAPIICNAVCAYDKLMPIAELKKLFNQKNRNKHPAEQIARLAEILKYQGSRHPAILSNLSSLVVAGHGRIEAAEMAGWTHYPVNFQDFENEEQEYAFHVSDNAIALWADLDLSGINADLGNLGPDFELDLLGIKNFILEPAEKAPPPGDPDEIPEKSEPRAQKGDVWLLGEHRLMCGDSTNPLDVARLVEGEKVELLFTDPPYGVSAGGARTQNVKKKGIKKIENDDLRGEELEQFIFDALALAPLQENGSFYICYDQKTQYEFTAAIRKLGWKQRSTIVWNKNVFGLSGHKGYRPKFELVAFGYVGESYAWHGGNDQADVWDIPRPRERPGNHPTPKPVELVEKAILNSTAKGEGVLDLFAGVGSTLIACEKTGRRAFCMELDPSHVSTILYRWEGYTGQKAVLEEA